MFQRKAHLIPAHKAAPAAKVALGAPHGVMGRMGRTAHKACAEQHTAQHQQPCCAHGQPARRPRRNAVQVGKGRRLGIRRIGPALFDGQRQQSKGGKAVGTQHRKGQLFAAARGVGHSIPARHHAVS